MAKKKTKTRKIITAADKRKAAAVLAYAGYRKDKRAPRGSILAAARQAKVSCQTIDKWCKDEDFQGAIEELSSEIMVDCVHGLRKSAKGGNVTASIFLLKTLDPDRFDDGLRAAREKQRLANEAMAVALEKLPQINIVSPPDAEATKFADKYALIMDAIKASSSQN